jgi:hypothetical protein
VLLRKWNERATHREVPQPGLNPSDPEWLRSVRLHLVSMGCGTGWFGFRNFSLGTFAMIWRGEQRISLSFQDAAAADFCLSET